MNYKFIVIFLFVGFIYGCASEIEEPRVTNQGYEYYPLSIGSYKIFQSDSIVYSRNGSRKDTLRGFIKEEILDKSNDLLGNEVFRIGRTFRRSENDPWLIQSNRYAYRNKNEAVRKEENLTFVKMVFPIKERMRFNGNQYFHNEIRIPVGGDFIEPYKNWRHQILRVDSTINFLGKDIKVMEVELVDNNLSSIERRYANEIYGYGIGLISSHSIILDTNSPQQSIPWEQKANKGFIHSLKLIEYQ